MNYDENQVEIERVARLLCLADQWDPDVMVLNPKHAPIGPKGNLVIYQAYIVASWKLYWNEAMAVIKDRYGH